MTILESSEAEIIQKLKNKDENTFDKIYLKCKSNAIGFLINNGASPDDAEDIYQDANIVLYQNLQKSDFELTCTIQTYLNSICRFQLLNRFRKTKNDVKISDTFNFEENIQDWFPEFDPEKEDRIQKIEKALSEFETLETKCFEILKNYFYKNMTMEEIALNMGYTNGDNVKNQKSRCQKKLKEMVYAN